MIELKPLQLEAISAALKKAERYRLLNEPEQAESICLDILSSEPEHQEAMITLLLALTDKFRSGQLNPAYNQAHEILDTLEGSFNQSYYRGVIYERRAKLHLKQGSPNSGIVAYNWFVKAMEAFNQALVTDDPKNQDAVLRWNSCARILNGNPDVKADDSNNTEPMLDSFDTPH